MMHMYPYNNFNLNWNFNFNSFKDESSFVQGFTFQPQQNWNSHDQLTIDPFIIENNHPINLPQSTDRNLSQQNFDIHNAKKKKSNHIYSNFTIPSITSIISPLSTITNTTNFLPSLSNNNLSSSIMSSIPSIPSIPPTSIDNENSIQSSNALSYFSTPDKDTTISLQDIIDGMKVTHEISKELSNYENNSLINNLATGLNDNSVDDDSIDWLIQEDLTQDNWKDISKHNDSILPEKKDEKCFQYVDDLIEEHMKEIKKVVQNEILRQEISTESSDLSFKNLSIETSQINNDNSLLMSSIPYSQSGIINQEDINSLSSDIFISQENNFFYDTEITNSTTVDQKNQKTFKCNEIGCSREYNCYVKLKSHKMVHTGDKPFMCNVLGCNKKFKRSGELIKHQLDHLN